MEYGKRIIFDKSTGKVLNYCLEEMAGDLQEGLRPLEMDFIDLPFGYNENNFKEAIEYHVDIETKEIVIDKYKEIQLTPEQQIIKELENQLLLKEGVI